MPTKHKCCYGNGPWQQYNSLNKDTDPQLCPADVYICTEMLLCILSLMFYIVCVGVC